MIRVMFISFWTNLILTISKVIVGYTGFNHALIADGIASFSDMITDIFAIVGGKISKKRANKNHPFGYGKVENIASLAVGTFIIIMGFYVVFNISLNKDNNPKLFTLVFTVLFIIIKTILVKYLVKMGKSLNSEIILDSSLESKNDIYGSIIVLITTSLMFLTDIFEIFKYADLVGTLIISFLIFKTGITIISHNINELIDERYSGDINKEAEKIILKNKEIDSIKKLYLFRFGTYYQLVAEVIFKKDIHISKAHDVIEKIEDNLKDLRIKYVFIEIDSK